jgi:hypothetical protein
LRKKELKLVNIYQQEQIEGDIVLKSELLTGARLDRLRIISARLLHPVGSLVILDLSHNLLATGCQTCLGPTSFQGLAQLVLLNLAANKITSLLQPSMFQACSAAIF